mmetsp:Transcript_18011/g.32233  ORF Transcript_18011/g.32233 Transcript_18011/m.32233 type:complete len:234 (-) Transcript_18011:668-1369(-)
MQIASWSSIHTQYVERGYYMYIYEIYIFCYYECRQRCVHTVCVQSKSTLTPLSLRGDIERMIVHELLRRRRRLRPIQTLALCLLALRFEVLKPPPPSYACALAACSAAIASASSTSFALILTSSFGFWASSPRFLNMRLSASSSGFGVVSSFSPAKIELAPDMNIMACSDSLKRARPAESLTFDCGMTIRVVAIMRHMSQASTGSSFSRGVPSTATSALIGTDSGGSSMFAST